MKLYTESQIRDALDNEDFAYISDLIIAKMQSIELPTDEEIMKKSKGEYYIEEQSGFIIGAVWIKEQIINQNK